MSLDILHEYAERTVQNTLALRGHYNPFTGEVPEFTLSCMAMKNIMAKLYMRFLFIAQTVSQVRETGSV